MSWDGLPLLIAAISAVLIGHVALWIASRRYNALFLLAAAFCIVSPLSAATALPIVGLAKYARVYVTVIMLVVGVLLWGLIRWRTAAWALMVFVAYYTLAGVWSDYPLQALSYKGLYAAATVSGLLLAYGVRDLWDLRSGLRILALAAGLLAVAILLDLLRNPSAISHIGRLATWGINPNRIGQTVAPLMFVTAFVALYDVSRRWRTFGYATSAMLALIILYTGSRGAAGMALVGCFVIALPLVRRPFVLAAVFAIVAVTALVLMRLVQTEGAQRITGGATLETRDAPWSDAFALFREAPIFGTGWVYDQDERFGATTRNLTSAYLQVLAETGLLGIALMAACLAIIGLRALQARAVLRRIPADVPVLYFALGAAAGILAHGFIESGTIMGSTINSVMLALSVGLFDRLPHLVEYEAARQGWDSWSDSGMDSHGNSPDIPLAAPPG